MPSFDTPTCPCHEEWVSEDERVDHSVPLESSAEGQDLELAQLLEPREDLQAPRPPGLQSEARRSGRAEVEHPRGGRPHRRKVLQPRSRAARVGRMIRGDPPSRYRNRSGWKGPSWPRTLGRNLFARQETCLEEMATSKQSRCKFLEPLRLADLLDDLSLQDRHFDYHVLS